MTQQYLAGELSLLLAQLQAVAADPVLARNAARLRWEAETGPLTVLPSVTARALELTDDLCWGSLSRGDTPSFKRQALVAADLREFGVCACLITEA